MTEKGARVQTETFQQRFQGSLNVSVCVEAVNTSGFDEIRAVSANSPPPC